uniref:trichohyalin-like n=1 Tax=Pristiophorus japonicus TaxID=55135 RepID=UPI00398EB8DE
MATRRQSLRRRATASVLEQEERQPDKVPRTQHHVDVLQCGSFTKNTTKKVEETPGKQTPRSSGTLTTPSAMEIREAPRRPMLQTLINFPRRESSQVSTETSPRSSPGINVTQKSPQIGNLKKIIIFCERLLDGDTGGNSKPRETEELSAMQLTEAPDTLLEKVEEAEMTTSRRSQPDGETPKRDIIGRRLKKADSGDGLPQKGDTGRNSKPRETEELSAMQLTEAPDTLLETVEEAEMTTSRRSEPGGETPNSPPKSDIIGRRLKKADSGKVDKKSEDEQETYPKCYEISVVQHVEASERVKEVQQPARRKSQRIASQRSLPEKLPLTVNDEDHCLGDNGNGPAEPKDAKCQPVVDELSEMQTPRLNEEEFGPRNIKQETVETDREEDGVSEQSPPVTAVSSLSVEDTWTSRLQSDSDSEDAVGTGPNSNLTDKEVQTEIWKLKGTEMELKTEVSETEEWTLVQGTSSQKSGNAAVEETPPIRRWNLRTRKSDPPRVVGERTSERRRKKKQQTKKARAKEAAERIRAVNDQADVDAAILGQESEEVTEEIKETAKSAPLRMVGERTNERMKKQKQATKKARAKEAAERIRAVNDQADVDAAILGQESEEVTEEIKETAKSALQLIVSNLNSSRSFGALQIAVIDFFMKRKLSVTSISIRRSRKRGQVTFLSASHRNRAVEFNGQMLLGHALRLRRPHQIHRPVAIVKGKKRKLKEPDQEYKPSQRIILRTSVKGKRVAVCQPKYKKLKKRAEKTEEEEAPSPRKKKKINPKKGLALTCTGDGGFSQEWTDDGDTRSGPMESTQESRAAVQSLPNLPVTFDDLEETLFSETREEETEEPVTPSPRQQKKRKQEKALFSETREEETEEPVTPSPRQQKKRKQEKAPLSETRDEETEELVAPSPQQQKKRKQEKTVLSETREEETEEPVTPSPQQQKKRRKQEKALFSETREEETEELVAPSPQQQKKRKQEKVVSSKNREEENTASVLQKKKKKYKKKFVLGEKRGEEHTASPKKKKKRREKETSSWCLYMQKVRSQERVSQLKTAIGDFLNEKTVAYKEIVLCPSSCSACVELYCEEDLTETLEFDARQILGQAARLSKVEKLGALVDEDDPRTLYVRNLPNEVCAKDLKHLFEKVAGVWIQERQKISKRFAFIAFETTKAAEIALSTSEIECKGMLITLKHASQRGKGKRKVLMVENLPSPLTKKYLKSMFSGAENVQVSKQQDSQSQGIAYVEYRTARRAKMALKEFRDKGVPGQATRVDSIAGRIESAKSKSDAAVPVRSLFIWGLSSTTSVKMLKSTFKGAVTARLPRSAGRRFAFVDFETAEEAARTRAEMQDVEIDGHKVKLYFANTTQLQEETPSCDLVTNGAPEPSRTEAHARQRSLKRKSSV